MGEEFENASRRMKDKVLKLNQCIFYSDTQYSDKRKLKKGGYELTVYKAVNIFAHLFRTCMKNIVNLLFSITQDILRSRSYEN